VSKEATVEKYIEAVKTLRALEQAAKDDGMTPERAHAIKEAKGVLGERMRVMRGGDIALAQRRMREEGLK